MCNTLVAVEPSSMFAASVRPCVPMKMRSQRVFAACWTMSSATCPTRMLALYSSRHANRATPRRRD